MKILKFIEISHIVHIKSKNILKNFSYEFKYHIFIFKHENSLKIFPKCESSRKTSRESVTNFPNFPIFQRELSSSHYPVLLKHFARIIPVLCDSGSRHDKDVVVIFCKYFEEKRLQRDSKIVKLVKLVKVHRRDLEWKWKTRVKVWKIAEKLLKLSSQTETSSDLVLVEKRGRKRKKILKSSSFLSEFSLARAHKVRSRTFSELSSHLHCARNFILYCRVVFFPFLSRAGCSMLKIFFSLAVLCENS